LQGFIYSYLPHRKIKKKTTEGKSSVTSAELIKQLQSKDPAQTIKALHKLEKVANINDLPSIVSVMAGLTDPGQLNQFAAFLSNIRSKKAPEFMVGFLSDPSLAGIRTILTRACWESQLDYSSYLMIFARLFITGDYLLALEAFSVIENTCLERPVNKVVLTEISILIKNSLPDQPEAKQALTIELIKVLEPLVAEG
jgi:hypothetical protein